jgi:hypothetical protein
MAGNSQSPLGENRIAERLPVEALFQFFGFRLLKGPRLARFRRPFRTRLASLIDIRLSRNLPASSFQATLPSAPKPTLAWRCIGKQD